MNRKLGVVVSALLLGLQIGRVLAATPSQDQLVEIETLLTNNDIAGLRQYLELNPDLLEGETELALLLRRFFRESQNITSFLHAPDLRDALAEAAPAVALDDEGSDSGEDPDSGEGDPDGEPIY